MDLTLQINREKVNSGRVYLYVTGRILKAYELSAFILTKCFPDIELSEEIDRQSARIIYSIALDVDFAAGNEAYEIWVGNDCIEMKIFDVATKLKVPEWIVEFEQLKEQQRIENSSLLKS